MFYTPILADAIEMLKLYVVLFESDPSKIFCVAKSHCCRLHLSRTTSLRSHSIHKYVYIWVLCKFIHLICCEIGITCASTVAAAGTTTSRCIFLIFRFYFRMSTESIVSCSSSMLCCTTTQCHVPWSLIPCKWHTKTK